ncbi:hypothetical protein Dimus_011294 [Dionaea muscipula]
MAGADLTTESPRLSARARQGLPPRGPGVTIGDAPRDVAVDPEDGTATVRLAPDDYVRFQEFQNLSAAEWQRFQEYQRFTQMQAPPVPPAPATPMIGPTTSSTGYA